jgi:hypothetical protein
MDQNEIIKEQVVNAPEEIKNILRTRSWIVVTDGIAAKNNFSPEQRASFENEVLFILLGMELVKDLSFNIKTNVGLTEDHAKQLSTELYEKIYKNVEKLLPTETESESITKPESKEEAMRRLSDRMRGVMNGEAPKGVVHENLPMVEPGEVVHDVPHVETAPEPKPEAPPKIEVAEKAPTAPDKPSTPSYSPGKDPYREPIE